MVFIALGPDFLGAFIALGPASCAFIAFRPDFMDFMAGVFMAFGRDFVGAFMALGFDFMGAFLALGFDFMGAFMAFGSGFTRMTAGEHEEDDLPFGLGLQGRGSVGVAVLGLLLGRLEQQDGLLDGGTQGCIVKFCTGLRPAQLVEVLLWELRGHVRCCSLLLGCRFFSCILQHLIQKHGSAGSPGNKFLMRFRESTQSFTSH